MCGAEQLVIERHGAQSERGTSANRINGISRENHKRPQYLLAALKEFPLREISAKKRCGYRRIPAQGGTSDRKKSE
jgi:hypothetical protein